MCSNIDGEGCVIKMQSRRWIVIERGQWRFPWSYVSHGGKVGQCARLKKKKKKRKRERFTVQCRAVSKTVSGGSFMNTWIKNHLLLLITWTHARKKNVMRFICSFNRYIETLTSSNRTSAVQISPLLQTHALHLFLNVIWVLFSPAYISIYLSLYLSINKS